MSALHDEQDREFVHTNLHRVCANQGRGCEGCTNDGRTALGIAPGCNPLESRVVRLFVVLMAVIAVCAVVARWWTR